MGGRGRSAAQREHWEVQRTRAAFRGLLCSPVTPLPVRGSVRVPWVSPRLLLQRFQL